MASEVRPGASLRQTLERLLDILVELDPGSAAGVRVTLGDDTMLVRRSDADLTDDITATRLFPEIDKERSAQLASPLDGSLHFAGDGFFDPVLITQAAAVVSLVLRVLRPKQTGDVAAAVDMSRIAQLEKLATIGQAASEIVHELNNPLTAIIAYSDFLSKRLRDANVSEGDLERLRRIHEAANRIQQFCRDLTDYSRPQSSLRGPLDVHAVIDRALGFCVHGLHGADIAVERVYRDVPFVDGVESALTQVFVNLFTNAWHAMDGRGGGTLSIRTKLVGQRVTVEVADEGPGIEEEHLARIFDQYFTTKPSGSGVGLGLAIVKQIVGDHGGTVRVINREEGGAVFAIDLPGTV